MEIQSSIPEEDHNYCALVARDNETASIDKSNQGSSTKRTRNRNNPEMSMEMRKLAGNLAVRKSRAKSKLKIVNTKERIEYLKEFNFKLQSSNYRSKTELKFWKKLLFAEYKASGTVQALLHKSAKKRAQYRTKILAVNQNKEMAETFTEMKIRKCTEEPLPEPVGQEKNPDEQQAEPAPLPPSAHPNQIIVINIDVGYNFPSNIIFCDVNPHLAA